MSKIAIIGTGPSAFAASKALENKGLSFQVFDAGLKEHDLHRAEYAQNQFTRVTRKLFFGSDLPYRNVSAGPELTVASHKDIGVTRSFTRGGLSNVWGATLLPLHPEELKDFPATIDSYYSFLSKYMPISANRDEITSAYKLDYANKNPLVPTPRYLEIINLKGRSDDAKLISIAGAPALAVGKDGSDSLNHCAYCAKCIEGCPLGVIWSSVNNFNILESNSTTIEPVYVRSIKRQNNGLLTLVARDTFSNEEILYSDFSKVLLGTGPIETFRILNDSDFCKSSATIRDSQIMFNIFYTGSVNKRKKRHVLAQMIVRIEDKAKVLNPIHMQFYEFTSDLTTRARQTNRIAKLVPKFLLDYFLKRCVFSISYLDSRDSGNIQIKNEDSRILVETSPTDFRKIEHAQNLIQHWGKQHGFFGNSLLTKIGQPGESIHYGATYEDISVDLKSGQVINCPGVHVIDSSVLKYIPAGPVTFTIMANSARIASEELF